MKHSRKFLAASVGLLFAAGISYGLGQVWTAPALTLADVQAILPQPNTAIPPPEAVGGAVGTAVTYLRSDAIPPRITRATNVVTGAGGTFSGTWGSALSAVPTLILTPISNGSSAVACQLTALPTTTTFAGQCWTSQTTTLNLSIITAGLNLNPFAAAASGIPVQVIAIPPTQ